MTLPMPMPAPRAESSTHSTETKAMPVERLSSSRNGAFRRRAMRSRHALRARVRVSVILLLASSLIVAIVAKWLVQTQSTDLANALHRPVVIVLVSAAAIYVIALVMVALMMRRRRSAATRSDSSSLHRSS